jgi:hypothetical protein
MNGEFQGIQCFQNASNYIRDTLNSRAILLIRFKLKLCKKLVLPPSLKEHGVKQCINVEKCFFGLAMNDVRHVAYQLAQGNNTRNSFPKANEKAGKNGLNIFFSSIHSLQ